jgi:hypothetical protein
MIVYEITRSDLTKKNFNNKTVICTDEKETVNFDTKERNEIISKILARMILDRTKK